MQNILGISLGTRFLGMAVVYDGELSGFRVRTFYGKWTGKKRSAMIVAMRKMIVRHGITSIATKIPKPAHCSPNIHELLGDLRLLSAELDVKLTECTITQLTMKYGGNRRELVRAIIRKYPQYGQLAKLSVAKRSNPTAYRVKLFEAIACAEIELEAVSDM